MKAFKVKFCVAGFALAVGSSALASGYGSDYASGYGSVSYAFHELTVESEEFDLDSVYGRIGAQFNEFVSAEFRVGIGVSDDSLKGPGGELSVEIDKYFGGYVRGSMPINEVIAPYVVVGYTDVELEVDFDTFLGEGSESDSDGDISYGVGVDFMLDRNLLMNVEYLNMYDDDDVEISGFSLGIGTKF